MDDTSPEIKEMLFNKYMSMSGVERLKIGCSMFETAKKMAFASFQKDLSEREKIAQLFLRFYGHEFLEKDKIKILEKIRKK